MQQSIDLLPARLSSEPVAVDLLLRAHAGTDRQADVRRIFT